MDFTMPGLENRASLVAQMVTTWMDLEGIMLSEIKSDRDKYCTVSLICRI